jgi:hypothetical protein
MSTAAAEVRFFQIKNFKKYFAILGLITKNDIALKHEKTHKSSKVLKCKQVKTNKQDNQTIQTV